MDFTASGIGLMTVCFEQSGFNTMLTQVKEHGTPWVVSLEERCTPD